MGVMKPDGGSVLDRLGDAVLVQVPLLIVTAEGLECPLALADPVYRRAGEPDEGSVRQRCHQVDAQCGSTHGAMRLVDEHRDVGASVDVGRHVVELVEHRHDQPTVVGLQYLPQMLLALRHQRAADAAALQIPEQLGL